ncbi:glycoside hydrolase family 55 protein [Rothia sp. HMSC075F09]|uniref:glycoside hydrolase family 55 protein n=1 Tax=Rothia sp. HMSC075F09 TaxID=1739253 RepID=UPI000A53965A|nr:glycoside hydrolase family 55 protein [Rothia sp. HMSC075F09]
MPDTPMSINAINYGADPTGAKDSTAAIQRAVDDVAARGGGSVELPRGIYRVSYPFIDIKHRVEIFGYGSSTVVIAHSDRAIPTTANGHTEYTGVFHVGSYTTPVYGNYNANKPMRMGVRNLHIRTNAANTPHQQLPARCAHRPAEQRRRRHLPHPPDRRPAQRTGHRARYRRRGSLGHRHRRCRARPGRPGHEN